MASRGNGAHTFAGEYFAEEVRRDIFERYGEKKLYEGGLSVRTTLDPKLQVMARKTMAAGLVNFDEAQGWRGAMSKLDISGDWGVKLAEIKSLERHLAMADGGGAGDIRPVGAHRLPARPRTGRRGLQGPANRPHHAGRCPMGEAGRRPRRAARRRRLGLADSVAGRRDLRRSAVRQGRQGRSKASIACGNCPKCPAPWSRWTRGPAACSRWSAASRSTRASSIARRRPIGSRDRRSSRWSIRRRSTMATRRRRIMIDGPIEIDQGQGDGVWRPENFSVGSYQGPDHAARSPANSRSTP